MGSCLSCPFQHPSKPKLRNVIRVVHLDGYVEDFDCPITAGHLIGRPPRHVVCTPDQLLSTGSTPMRADTLLQPGHVYFLLPYSVLKADVSPIDLSPMVRRLMAKAKASGRPADDGKKSPGHTPPRRSLDSSPGRSLARSEGCAVDPQRSVGGRSWKPVLDTIRERSFHRRSALDLQEDHVPC